MTDNTPTTLNCPSCGAPLEVDGRSALVRCKFCKNTAFVPGIAAVNGSTPQMAVEEIRRLARSGNMIEAIRQYRELYGVGLKEAKDAVEALAAGKVAGERPPVSRPATAEDTSRVLEEVKELLQRGQKIEAIKRYREVHDTSLAQAKDAVDQVEAALTGIPVQPRPVITGTPSVYSKPAKKSSAGCFVAVSILAFVGIFVGLLFFLPGGPLTDMLIANGPALLVESAAGSTDVLAAFYNGTDETYIVGYLASDTGKLAWQTEALPGDSYFDALIWDGEMIYAASDANLLAYHLTDGSLAWQVVMPDTLNYGDTNIIITSGRVIVSSVDQTLRSYDASTGALVWERRVEGYDRTLRLIDSSLVVVDYVGDSYDYALIFIDPETGAEERTFTPGCFYSDYILTTPDPDSPLLYDAASNDLIFISDNYSGCIQRLDLATGEPLWEYQPESSFSFSPYGMQLLETEDTIYFSTYDQLLAVNKTSGSVVTLLANEDYEFLPLAVNGDTLLVRAKRTRGTTRFELWGVDTASGAALWQMDMGNAQPVDPPDEMIGLIDDSESGWTWNLLAGQLVLLKFQAAPHQLVIQTVDMADGSLSSETIVELKSVIGDFYSIPDIIGWDGTRVYFTLDAKIYCVDVSTGEILFKFQ